MTPAPIVRFAPSPTGMLHIGGARTALYNWLYARKRGGRFILRIEDTDVGRSTPEAEQVIYDAMRWLGLDWDEGPDVGGAHGPYRQSERQGRYRAAADRLIAEGKAYRCDCTPEKLAELRKAAGDRGFRYPGLCRDKGLGPDVPHVVRFRVPDTGTTGWDDLVKGRIEVANETLQDEVILRTNSMPLYNFGAVVDDVDMEVNLVVRGDDHVINTPRQLRMYEALGAPLPRFAHLPMILGEDKKKLSKRTGTVSVLAYRDQGYLPHALLNYLARVGWSHGDQEIFTREELVDAFDFDAVSKSGGVWNAKKLEWLNAQTLKTSPVADIAASARPFLVTHGVTDAGEEQLQGAILLQRERAKTLVELAAGVAFYFQDPLPIDPAAATKFLTPEAIDRVLALAGRYEGLPTWDVASLEAATTAYLTEQGLELKAIAQAVRVAVVGRTNSPGLYEVMAVLGRERSLARLRTARRAPGGTGAA